MLSCVTAGSPPASDMTDLMMMPKDVIDKQSTEEFTNVYTTNV